MTSDSRYASLRDYLAMLRRQRLLIIAVTLLFAGAGAALAASGEDTYEAEAAVEFRDISQDLRILNTNVIPADTPQQRALTSAEQVTKLSVAKQVARRLRGEGLSPQALQAAVGAQVEGQSSLVLISASASDPELAARIANGFATASVEDAVDETERQLDAAISALEQDADPGDETPELNEVVANQQLPVLRAAKQIAQPAEVTRRAEAPGAPSNASPARSGALAGIVGFALALVAAFVRDSLDRRLRTARDIHEELGVPIVGRVGAAAMGSVGMAVTEATKRPQAADLEAFRMLRTNLAFLEAEGAVRTVLVTSGLPEEGKSTVAASLASASAAAGQRTLLVDADLRRPTLAARLSLRATPGLAEYLQARATPKEVLQVVDVDASSRTNGARDAEPASRQALACIAAGSPPPNPAELLATERCADFIRKIGHAYDLVVIDSSPMLSSADPLELIPLVDAVLVCVRAERTTRDEARALQGALSRLPERPHGVVVTGLGAEHEDYGYYGYA